MEGDRRIIAELNGDDVTNCVIAEDVNDLADRVRAEWPWLFLGHLIANAKFRCEHRPAPSASNAALNRYINNCWCTPLQKYRDNCPGTQRKASAPGGSEREKCAARGMTRLRQSLAVANDVCE